MTTEPTRCAFAPNSFRGCLLSVSSVIQMEESTVLETDSRRSSLISNQVPGPAGSTLRKLLLHDNLSCVTVHIYCTANMAEKVGADPTCPFQEPLFSRQVELPFSHFSVTWCGWRDSSPHNSWFEQEMSSCCITSAWYPRRDLNSHWNASKAFVSCRWTTRAKLLLTLLKDEESVLVGF